MLLKREYSRHKHSVLLGYVLGGTSMSYRHGVVNNMLCILCPATSESDTSKSGNRVNTMKSLPIIPVCKLPGVLFQLLFDKRPILDLWWFNKRHTPFSRHIVKELSETSRVRIILYRYSWEVIRGVPESPLFYTGTVAQNCGETKYSIPTKVGS